MAHRGYHQEGLRPSSSKLQTLEKISTRHSTTSPEDAAWGASMCELSTVFCTELNARTNANIRLGGRAVGKPRQLFVTNSSYERGKPAYGLLECTPQGIEAATFDLLGGEDDEDDITLNEEEILAWKNSKGRRRSLKSTFYSLLGDDSSIDMDDFTLGSQTRYTEDASTIATTTTRGSDSRISLQRLRKAHTLESDGDSKSRISSLKKGFDDSVQDTSVSKANREMATGKDTNESTASVVGMNKEEESKMEAAETQPVLEQDGLSFAAADNNGATAIAKTSSTVASVIEEENSQDLSSSDDKKEIEHVEEVVKEEETSNNEEESIHSAEDDNNSIAESEDESVYIEENEENNDEANAQKVSESVSSHKDETVEEEDAESEHNMTDRNEVLGTSEEKETIEAVASNQASIEANKDDEIQDTLPVEAETALNDTKETPKSEDEDMMATNGASLSQHAKAEIQTDDEDDEKDSAAADTQKQDEDDEEALTSFMEELDATSTPLTEGSDKIATDQSEKPAKDEWLQKAIDAEGSIRMVPSEMSIKSASVRSNMRSLADDLAEDEDRSIIPNDEQEATSKQMPQADHVIQSQVDVVDTSDAKHGSHEVEKHDKTEQADRTADSVGGVNVSSAKQAPPVDDDASTVIEVSVMGGNLRKQIVSVCDNGPHDEEKSTEDKEPLSEMKMNAVDAASPTVSRQSTQSSDAREPKNEVTTPTKAIDESKLREEMEIAMLEEMYLEIGSVNSRTQYTTDVSILTEDGSQGGRSIATIPNEEAPMTELNDAWDRIDSSQRERSFLSFNSFFRRGSDPVEQRTSTHGSINRSLEEEEIKTTSIGKMMATTKSTEAVMAISSRRDPGLPPLPPSRRSAKAQQKQANEDCESNNQSGCELMEGSESNHSSHVHVIGDEEAIEMTAESSSESNESASVKKSFTRRVIKLARGSNNGNKRKFFGGKKKDKVTTYAAAPSSIADEDEGMTGFEILPTTCNA